MPQTGDRFEMPDGSVYTLTSSAADNDGEFVEFEWLLPPDNVSPPPHIHPACAEGYEVTEGSFEVMTDGDWRMLTRGQSATVPPGVSHTFRNKSGQPVRIRTFHRPAHRFDDFVEQMHDVLRDHGITRARDPRIPILLSMVMLEYPDNMYPSGPQRFGVRAAAGLGRLLRLNKKVSASP